MPYKDIEKKREYQRKYHEKWRKENPDKWKEIQRKSESRPERKEYTKIWWKESSNAKEIRKRNYNNGGKEKIDNWVKLNKEKVRAKDKKYYDSIKGTINFLKKRDRTKFKIENKEITIELIKFINSRDKICPYCNGKFEPRYEYDHINPFKPLSKFNILKCCSSCNQSKNNADLIQWMKFNKLEITQEIQKIYHLAYK